MTSSGTAFELLKSWSASSKEVRLSFNGRSVKVNLKAVVLREVRETEISAGRLEGDFRWIFGNAEFSLTNDRTVLIRAGGEDCSVSGSTK